MSDLAGNDVGWFIRKHRYAEHPEERETWTLVDALCERGRFGQKTGQGWYRYEPGRREPIPDPAVDEIIVARSAELGIARRKIDDEEIVHRCVLALVNEGALILEEEIAQRASDLDLVYLNGYGFPAQRGGPMLYADTLGVDRVLRLMRRFATRPRGGASWSPAPLLTRLAADGTPLIA
jgi:3-hydroxyacyl-CoA dehydrogenase